MLRGCLARRMRLADRRIFCFSEIAEGQRRPAGEMRQTLLLIYVSRVLRAQGTRAPCINIKKRGRKRECTPRCVCAYYITSNQTHPSYSRRHSDARSRDTLHADVYA
jgi:hypothetical protein